MAMKSLRQPAFDVTASGVLCTSLPTQKTPEKGPQRLWIMPSGVVLLMADPIPNPLWLRMPGSPVLTILLMCFASQRDLVDLEQLVGCSWHEISRIVVWGVTHIWPPFFRGQSDASGKSPCSLEILSYLSGKLHYSSRKSPYLLGKMQKS